MTVNAATRTAVIKALQPKLSVLGFEKKSATFQRETETGILQIIDFTLGPSWSSQRDHIGVGFGIYIEEVFQFLAPGRRPRVLTSADCEIRDIYCDDVPKDDSSWFRITAATSQLTEEIWNYISVHYLTVLERLRNRGDIIKGWETRGPSIGLPPRGRLSVGIIKWHMGELGEAQKLFALELRLSVGKPYYAFVQKKVSEIREARTSPNP